MILFIHGFNSSPSQDDVTYLQNQFPTERIVAPFIEYSDVKLFNYAIDNLVNL